MVFTLYQGVEHPFIHALESTDAWALCIDLPTSNAAPASTTSGPANRDWGMAFMPDGQSLVAANSTIGLAVKIESDLTVHRVARFDPTASGAVTLAKFGHNDAVTAGQRVVMARNGSALYAAGSNGVVRLGPDDLTVLGRLLPGVAVTTLAVTNDRTRLFTLTGDGRILEVDLATESVVRAVEGGPFDRLVAVVPW
jgi:DNA-binding beta-propeller fold protein YncE